MSVPRTCQQQRKDFFESLVELLRSPVPIILDIIPKRRITVALHSMDLIYSGRRFSCEEMELMRQAAHDYASLGVTEIARTVCEWLDWKRPNGRPKNHECRLLLEWQHDEGYIVIADNCCAQ
jgi:hypothetical protein